MSTEPYRDAQVLVLGASGFVGRSVAAALTAQGARLALATRDAKRAAPIFARWGIAGDVHAVDLTAEGALAALIAEVRPAVTFDLTGYGVDPRERDEETAQRVNTDIPGACVRAIAETDCAWPHRAYVRVGTALEYGTVSGDLDEGGPAEPTTLYGRTKLGGTLATAMLAGANGVAALTARLFTVYGPGELPGRLLPALLETRATQRPLPLTAGLQQRDFTFVGDVAEGLLLLGLTDGEPGEVVNLATGRLLTVREFVERAAAVLGIDGDLLGFGEVPTRAEEMQHDPVSVSRLVHLTDWKPETDVDTGVRQTLEFAARANGGGTQ